jgi:predicted transcriptional regulator
MKQLLMSIQPQHLYNILTGKKTLEIRKQIPKGFKGWVNLYCTMVKPYLIKRSQPYDDYMLIQDKSFDNLNGKVVARFWFDEYDVIEVDSEQFNAITEKSCLTIDEIIEYCKGKDLYAWHIKKLEIFDKPKALSEFMYASKNPLIDKKIKSFKFYKPSLYTDIVDGKPQMIYKVEKAPQSYQYVWVKEN